MIIEFRKSFERDLRNIDNSVLLQKIQATIETIEMAISPTEIPNLKKMNGKGSYYRIRIGDYRMGLVLEKIHSLLYEFFLEKKYTVIFPSFPHNPPANSQGDRWKVERGDRVIIKISRELRY